MRAAWILAALLSAATVQGKPTIPLVGVIVLPRIAALGRVERLVSHGVDAIQGCARLAGPDVGRVRSAPTVAARVILTVSGGRSAAGFDVMPLSDVTGVAFVPVYRVLRSATTSQRMIPGIENVQVAGAPAVAAVPRQRDLPGLGDVGAVGHTRQMVSVDWYAFELLYADGVSPHPLVGSRGLYDQAREAVDRHGAGSEAFTTAWAKYQAARRVAAARRTVLTPVARRSGDGL